MDIIKHPWQKKTPTIKIIITIPLTSFLIYQIKTTLILSITQKKQEKLYEKNNPLKNSIHYYQKKIITPQMNNVVKRKKEYNLEYIPIIKPRHVSLSTISNVNSIKKNYV